MLRPSSLFLAILCWPLMAAAAPAGRSVSTVVLDEASVKNLKLESVEAEETTFENTVFALGHLEALPEQRAVVSSRIAGRVLEIKATLGDTVQAGAVVARIESRQPGDPPPSVVLKAPLSGLVTESMARLGEPVDPDKALLEITDLREVLATASVPEHLAGLLQPGVQAHLRVVALPEEKLEGELLRFGTAADRESGTIEAVFRLANPQGLLRPGMRVEFSIVLSKRENVMSIPRTALQGSAASRFVYVEDFDLPFAYVKTEVQTGAQNDRMVEILGGVLPGDKVVTRGGYALAFAGKGSVSLKEALDAAHGHEHNEDGSELSPEQKARQGPAGNRPGEHQHEHEESGGTFRGLTLFFAVTSVVLFALLVVAVRARRQPVLS